ncbi:helix-turn-helix domain-containing protein [Mucilaginibacter sp. L3T2-6]|uniref:helix-turn-helix domain-containing protein n=1 Tax=Mucilaginibacter sp. L3T2-6 TaxID=3062491 RepID=UPI0026766FFD|nr:helix-turn-helix domain-containing protein [Mucilaginibacter sp. L3T2-6]MDO3644258.1 helix-turn-helix domain-containing protein [Mucilaginibacter sp. L3T2-6]MDV6216645.1 helix-turn-helix domain-containing protein [Mucilaginibacter sp. L3T2-6]
MLNSQRNFTLVNPQTGNLAFRLFSFNDNSHFCHLQRHNFYTIIWITKGSGKMRSNFAEYDFEAGSLFAFAIYQPFMLIADSEIEGFTLNFHPDFFCIHKHDKEVACHGVLFNNIYEPPFVTVDEPSAEVFKMVIEQISAEMRREAVAQYELLISYLKIFLITAVRLKTEQQPATGKVLLSRKEPFILQNLKDAIETHYKVKHSASDYADMLNISAKALAKMTKQHFNRTLTDMIAERIVIEAKRELYLTNKPVKEIAFELGYNDEYYFSRFFKLNADVSPQVYRDTVGAGRAEVR